MSNENVYTVGLVSPSGAEDIDTGKYSFEDVRDAREFAELMLKNGAFTAHIHGPEAFYEALPNDAAGPCQRCGNVDVLDNQRNCWHCRQ